MNYPFENDTERIEKRIAEKSVFSEKNRTFLIRVIILIAAFLLSFSGILLCNATLSTQQIAHVNNTTEAVGTVLGIVIVLLCTAGLAVKNILYVSVLQRVHEFAQLRAIGATYQQIKSVVKKERDKIAKPCIVLGTVIGFLVNIVLPLHFYWIPSIVCAVISGIFIWIITALAFQAPAKMAASTSPIEAQHTQATNYFRSVGAKRKLTPIRIGWMYCRANRKKAAYTFLSLIMSGILMFGVFSILNAINPERLASQPYQGNSDVFVLLNSTADEESTYDLMKSTPFTEEKKQKLYNISGVKDVYELYMLDGILTNSEGEKFELSIENAVNPETFKNEIVEGMQPSHELQNGAIPVAINRQSPYYQKLNMQLQVGDYLPYIIDTGYGQKEVELVVSGFVENSDTGLVIYTSGENMKSLSEMNCTLAWYICLDDNGKDVATEIIKEIFIDDDRVDVSVLADDVMALETSVYKGYKQDKIEMRGDRAEMSDFPLYLNTVAGGLDRRDQTIGGFCKVQNRAAYTVQFIHDDPSDLSLADLAQQLLKLRPVRIFTGIAFVLEYPATPTFQFILAKVNLTFNADTVLAVY